MESNCALGSRVPNIPSDPVPLHCNIMLSRPEPDALECMPFNLSVNESELNCLSSSKVTDATDACPDQMFSDSSLRDQAKCLQDNQPSCIMQANVNNNQQILNLLTHDFLWAPFTDAMARRQFTLPLTQAVVKEGWLMKRGEHIKNWRRRYFILREDGTFYGYKSMPKDDMAQPLNNFTVRDCQLIVLNKPKPFTFLIRGLQWTNIVERLFFVETEVERKHWAEAIILVANKLKHVSEAQTPLIEVKLDENVELDLPQT
ncbi:unnamed protein product [Protopolystoma xenopodis]|uniref:PH domain-containing protein n=1 Tax=Protopolystoma xenopodis TaxID=117903 RepID=A0A3S4ZG04_9PLAT|nr:unnamed protein product [Protopolystoma xenopodis]